MAHARLREVGRAAQHRLESVWRWVAKSTDVVRGLTCDERLSLTTLSQAQAIALAQSRMLALAGTFERRLAQLAAQRVHLGSSGLTSTDIADWLRHQGLARLAGLADGVIAANVEPAFLTTPELADVAEYELLGRERAREHDHALPAAASAETADAVEAERLLEAEALYDTLAALQVLPADGVPISDAVLAASYNETAYRLSLLSLLGDPESRSDRGVIAALAKLPLALSGGAAVLALDHPEVASLSDAQLTVIPTSRDSTS